MNRLLITWRQEKVLTALWDGQRVVQFAAEDKGAEIRVGDIRVGRVTQFVKNINAAFIEVAPGISCFYQLKTGEKVSVGQEFPVVITREAVKTKMAVVSRALTLTGRDLVLVTDRRGFAFSGKLTSSQKLRLQEILAPAVTREDVGFILRTHAAEADADTLIREAAGLQEEYERILAIAPHRPAGSVLVRGIPAYMTMVQDAARDHAEEIVTDIPEIYEEILEFRKSTPGQDAILVRLYNDPTYSMSNLYRLEHYLAEALGRRVWLPSGGYLIIDPTEALTVIDVNTGKYSGKKNKEEAFLKIDLEACDAIEAQMRLRNLSGIILVDFIDLAEEEHRKALYSHLETCLAKDPVRSILVDITPLHLAEITRKKVRGTLAEQLKSKENLLDEEVQV